MAIVLRFVDNLMNTREEFLGFIPCQKGLSGEALSEEISNFIKDIGQCMEDCCGQGYDGAGNMAGKLSGVAARTQRIYDKAMFTNCYVALLSALGAIESDTTNKPDVRYRAGGMKKVIKKFEFIVCLILVECCLKCTKPLTLQLQCASLDAGKAREISTLYFTINKLRSDIDETHEAFYQMAIDLAKEVKIEPTKKRMTGSQVHRENVPADSTSDYYKRAVTIPFLDQLLGQMQSHVMYGMPNKVVSDPDWKENFSRFLNKYKDDLPDLDFLECELWMWRLKFCNLTDHLPTSLEELFPYADRLSFPNILTAMRIFGTIPVTSCSCERSISTLRRLKTFMRSTMGEKRLKALVLLNIHHKIKLDVEKVIDRFALKHPRRMLLVDLLNRDDSTLEESKDDLP
ncbi:52 kDa repressor of the inhibitor of the kinase-like [Paramuricea clavata]|uniref:52 kDa repressor of the inhibitor of the kinase-like n=1 Tax=Paramuricea clavata TaxID=317549 RepID=A0A6S7H2T6_PARCT|nr:52 kDa repressor of the inhibitor of the kinase-like [Paramuricea clavata]